jgi:hypothetical protein
MNLEKQNGESQWTDGHLIYKRLLDGNMVSPKISDEPMVLLMDNGHLMNNGSN